MTRHNTTSGDSPGTAHWTGIERRTEEILNVRADMSRRRSRQASLIDRIGQWLAHPAFFLTLLVSHAIWILLNLPLYPWFQPRDPYPFTFLATVASVEAPFIALLVLMRQWRDTRINELREEVNLQVSLHIERQTTMILRLLDEVEARLEIRTQEDREVLEHMKKYLVPRFLMHRLGENLDQTEGGDKTLES